MGPVDLQLSLLIFSQPNNSIIVFPLPNILESMKDEKSWKHEECGKDKENYGNFLCCLVRDREI